MRVSGHPVVFNSRSVDLGGFVEVISPVAADRTIRGTTDIVMLGNHDSNHPLARRSAKTMSVRKDQVGLYVEADVDEAISFASDIARVIARRDAPGASFGFIAIADIWSMVDGVPFREVVDMEVHEVSIAVPFPAYQATEIQVGGQRSVNAPRPVSVEYARKQLQLVKAR